MRKLILIGVATFCAGIVLHFPARVAIDWLLPDSIQISGVHGSIWSGGAATGQVGGIHFNDVAWSIKPLAMFTGKIAARLSVGTTAGRLDSSVAVGLGGSVTLDNLTGTLALPAIHPQLKASRIDGVVELALDRLIIHDGIPVFASGQVEIRDLVNGALGAFSIGDFHTILETEEDEIIGRVEDTSGTVDLDGVITLSPNRNYTFIGTIAATDRAPQAIARNLQYLGSPDAQGLRQFRFEGSL